MNNTQFPPSIPIPYIRLQTKAPYTKHIIHTVETLLKPRSTKSHVQKLISLHQSHQSHQIRNESIPTQRIEERKADLPGYYEPEYHFCENEMIIFTVRPTCSNVRLPASQPSQCHRATQIRPQSVYSANRPFSTHPAPVIFISVIRSILYIPVWVDKRCKRERLGFSKCTEYNELAA